jgi:1-acyl-sn-glycerol-3-phosphate acyltransferase
VTDASASASAAEAKKLARNTERVPVPDIHPITRWESILWRVLSKGLLGIGRLFFHTRVEGLENVPKDRPFILAPVHRSYVDFMLVLVCHRPRMRYLAKDTLWKPPFSYLWTALGGIPVARGVADRDVLKASIACIEQGEPLVMFPEGTRQEGPVVNELFDGPAYVQSKTGAPIVPVGIGGSARIMPKGSKFPKPGHVLVLIGKPLEAPQVEGAKAKRSAIKAQTAALRNAIQDLYDEAEANV